MKTNKNALQPLIKNPSLRLSFFSENIFLSHVITEEPCQHVQSDLAVASQNLKFAGQMSNARH